MWECKNFFYKNKFCNSIITISPAFILAFLLFSNIFEVIKFPVRIGRISPPVILILHIWWNRFGLRDARKGSNQRKISILPGEKTRISNMNALCRNEKTPLYSPYFTEELVIFVYIWWEKSPLISSKISSKSFKTLDFNAFNAHYVSQFKIWELPIPINRIALRCQ